MMKEKKEILFCEKLTLSTSTMISHPAHDHLSCPTIKALNQKNCKCLKSMAYKINITRPFQCCMNTYTPQKTYVLLDGCFSSFVISNKYINHYGKRISSHLMAEKSVYEFISCLPLWFVTWTLINSLNKDQIYHTCYDCIDVLFSMYLMWSYEVNHIWLDMKHQWTVDHSWEGPSITHISSVKSENLEKARMICSFKPLTNMKIIHLFTTVDNL